jgi:small-conductance mechanosensitive channel
MTIDPITVLQQTHIFGVAASDLAVAVVIIAVMFAGLQALRWIVLRQLVRVSGRTKTHADDVAADVLRRTRVYFIAFVSVWAGLQSLPLPSNVGYALRMLGVLLVTVQVASWGNVIIAAVVRAQMEKRLSADPGSATTMAAAAYILRSLFYVVLLLVALDNLGIEVRSLITTLGIGGIAIALALQKILGDLFGSLSIVLDKPFVLGDFIVVDDMSGTVEHIGLKTTRVKSLSGEQLVFANSDLLGARIRNFQRMDERRVAFTIGVTYQTPRELLARIPGMIRDAVERDEMLRLDRCHLKVYGPYSIDFETVYYFPTRDYGAYMDHHQALLLDIHRRFEEAGAEYAYPTQTVFVNGTAAGR